jgi:hypothetical protein
VCGEKQVRLAFLVLAIILGTLVVSLVLYWKTTRHVKLWVEDKRRLKASVKRLALRASELATSAATKGVDPQKDPDMLQWLDAVEGASPPCGKPRKGWYIIMDSNGNIWAHGKNPYLARDLEGRRHFGSTNMRMIDTPLAQDVPSHNMLREAIHNGGGYVDYVWRKNRLCVAYCRRAAGPHGLVVIGILLVPIDHTHWQQRKENEQQQQQQGYGQGTPSSAGSK